ncbi:hypothetical protein PCANC_14830 [Puccinia coronata f. sp. avenae]|uniref:Uncharacterized protein n=1 Tax=Puccinia coronata f. sp. avenae TaxID=200324 RepID=A0A2N5UIA4_9BASI|nr:hypothetical protein PCANC_14830 [Puccinia coronata f. sp. avenae]
MVLAPIEILTGILQTPCGHPLDISASPSFLRKSMPRQLISIHPIQLIDFNFSTLSPILSTIDHPNNQICVHPQMSSPPANW